MFGSTDSILLTEIFLVVVVVFASVIVGCTTSLIDLKIVENKLNEEILLFHAIDTIKNIKVVFKYLLKVWSDQICPNRATTTHCSSR